MLIFLNLCSNIYYLGMKPLGDGVFHTANFDFIQSLESSFLPSKRPKHKNGLNKTKYGVIWCSAERVASSDLIEFDVTMGPRSSSRTITAFW